jgi:hypothetical protein
LAGVASVGVIKVGCQLRHNRMKSRRIFRHRSHDADRANRINLLKSVGTPTEVLGWQDGVCQRLSPDFGEEMMRSLRKTRKL